MKRLGLSLTVVFVLALAVQSAMGRPDYKKVVDETFKESKVAEILKTEKCNFCHYGNTKKNRNDLGTALSKFLSKEKFEELKDQKDKLAEVVKDALKKVEAEKAECGLTFGELIKEGKDPGTNPKE
jgi:hypothetical protein